MGWVDKPMVFGNSLLSYPDTEYPVNVTGYNYDGTVTGTIDEERLSAVKRIILDGMTA